MRIEFASFGVTMNIFQIVEVKLIDDLKWLYLKYVHFRLGWTCTYALESIIGHWSTLGVLILSAQNLLTCLGSIGNTSRGA